MDDTRTAADKRREHETLGQFLRNTRVARAIDLNQIAEETRISGSNLRAMEADDYTTLPADAFARGFYALYAKALHLDPDEVVERFFLERDGRPSPLKQAAHKNAPLPGNMARQVSSMAEPVKTSPMSSLGFILLLLIIITGGICLYFSINPATYISEKLRQFQQVETESPAAAKDSSDTPATGPAPE